MTKYQVVTVPPLIILAVLGVIAAQKAADRARARRLTGLVAALVAIVFVVDLGGGILPWRHYGQMKAALEARRASAFRADDLFISSESGIDPIFARLYRGGAVQHVGVKDAFIEMPPREAFASIRAAIDRQLALGLPRLRLQLRARAVFARRHQPGAVGVTGSAALPRATSRSSSASCRPPPALRPVFSYWEESKAPLYLFGERLEPFFGIGARS